MKDKENEVNEKLQKQFHKNSSFNVTQIGEDCFRFLEELLNKESFNIDLQVLRGIGFLLILVSCACLMFTYLLKSLDF